MTPPAPTSQTSTPAAPGWRRHFGWLVVVAIAGAILIGLAIYFRVPAQAQALLKRAVEWIHTLGFWAPVVFILVYAIATICFAPGSVLTLSAGVIFGVVQGSIYVSIASTLGATGGFLVGRYLVRDWVVRKLGHNPTFQALDRAVAREGWKIVGLTRFSPIFPFAVLNYSLGLTRVPLWQYVLTSWICMIPWTVIYVYVGSLANTGLGAGNTWKTVLRLVGLAVTIVVTVFIARFAKRALSERITEVNG